MLSFGFDKASGRARNAEASLNPEERAAPNAGWHEDRAEDPKSARRRISEQKELLKSKRRELRKLRQETFAAKDGVERAEHVKKARKTRLELRALEDELRATRGGNPKVRTVPPSEGEEAQTTGALPDFVIAGAKKGAPIIGAGRSVPNGPSMDIPRLIVRPEGGLGNRMRVISSFQTLARHLGRFFELCWAPSDGWSEEDLNILFENDFPRVPLDEFERYCQSGLALHKASRTAGRGKKRKWEWRRGSRMHQVFDLETFPVVTYSGQARCDKLVDPDTRARLFRHFEFAYQASVKEWKPVPFIRAKVERLAATFGPYTVGVHIRRGDAWNQPDAALASKYRRSSDAAFFAHMDAELLAEPRTNFFLATDSAATEERFREHYREAVIFNRDKRFVPSIPGRPKDNQRDAVIDMFALARTRKILGNNYSSFSRMAADIGGIEYQRVLEN